MKSILFVCLVASTVALTCFTTDNAVETCANDVTKCYRGSYMRDGNLKNVSGCGIPTLCEDVNEAGTSRKKRAVETCDAGGNTIMLETEGMNTLACMANYVADEEYSEEEKTRYCYNGVAWKKHEYEGSAEPAGYNVFSCSRNTWLTVTVTTSNTADLTAVVMMNGEVQTGDFDVPTGTVLTVSCQFSGLTVATEITAGITADTTIAPCTSGDKIKTPTLGDLVIMEDDQSAAVEQPSYIAAPGDGTTFTLSCPADYVLTTTDTTVTYTVTSGNGEWGNTANVDCVNPTEYKVPAIPADKFQELWSASVGGIKLEVDAYLESSGYLRCMEGYEPAGDTAWNGEIYITLSFVPGGSATAGSATAATLKYADGTGSNQIAYDPDTISSCTKVAKMCTVADLGADMAKYGADTITSQAEGEVAADVVVVVKCEEDGFKQEYTNSVELMSYKCNGDTGSFGTVYASCLEYTECKTEVCDTGDGCNSSSALFSLLCLVIPLLHMAVY